MSKYKPNKYPQKKKCPYCGRIFKDRGTLFMECQCNKSRDLIKNPFNRDLKSIGKTHQG